MDVSIPPPSMPRRPTVAYEFGAFRLEPSEQRLTQGGQPVTLPRRAFEVLVFLVERSGHLVTKEELLEGLWSGLFVEEGNISQNVFLLRRALSHGSGETEYIETVPRKGYRFVAPVREVFAGPAVMPDETEPASPPPEGSPSFSRLRRALVVAAAALVLAAAVLWVLRRTGFPRSLRVRSIAILPLRSMDLAAGDDPLGFGIAEAAISRLSRSRALLVRPLSASRRAMETSADAGAAGALLGVDCVLDGGLRRSDGRVRATVELVRVRDRRVLWSDAFEEPAGESFRLEDSISERLVGALGLEIGLSPSPRARPVPASRAAYEAYLKGRVAWNRRGLADLDQSVRELEEAVRLDPNYALAWSGLADTCLLLGPTSPEMFQRARAAAERALGLDPDLAEAHASLGFTRFFSGWDFTGSERELRRAIQLDPGYATAHQWYAYWLAAAGRFDAAVAEIQRAREIDPLSLVLREDVGNILIYARRYGEAIAELRQLDPSFPKVRPFLVSALFHAGRFAEAGDELKRMEGWPDALPARTMSAWLAAAAGRVEEARALEPKLLDAAADGRVPPDAAAVLCGLLGEKERAFTWLDRAFAEHRFYLVFLNVDPEFDPLRLDPRFANLVRRVGIPS